MDTQAETSNTNFEEIVRDFPAGIMVIDAQGIILYVNDATCALLNKAEDALVGSDLGLPVISKNKVELDIYRGSGEMGIAELSRCAISWNRKPAYLVTFHDVTERYRAMDAMRHQALHDDLTGLPNRAHFHERLEESVGRANRESGSVSVLFIDLDRFKEVNDTLGHAAGDNLLREIARRLRDSVRKTDMVARMSGDEFAAVLEGVGEHDSAYHIAEKFRSNISAPVELDTETVFPSCSIGISIYPDDGESAKALLMRADTAMFKAKAHGRNRTCGFAIEQEEETSRRFRLGQSLLRAWKEGDFRLVYQPQVTLPDRNLAGIEVLLRCNTPELGEVGPEEFMPLLEETGLIHEIGLWVFSESAGVLGLDGTDSSLPGKAWINVSAKQLISDYFIDKLDRMIERNVLDPRRFGIELTEIAIAGNIERFSDVLNKLRLRGFSIAMADFGKGYSSLTCLHQLALDLVKVDKCFVQELTRSSRDRRMIRTIVAMAHSLELPVLAEGVETESQLTTLIEEKYDLAQGLLFSVPVTSDELEKFQSDMIKRKERSP